MKIVTHVRSTAPQVQGKPRQLANYSRAHRHATGAQSQLMLTAVGTQLMLARVVSTAAARLFIEL
jgi:hypothetical protein